jgi:hypothetical protein
MPIVEAIRQFRPTLASSHKRFRASFLEVFLPTSINSATTIVYAYKRRFKMADSRWYEMWQIAKQHGIFLDVRGEPDHQAFNVAYTPLLHEVENTSGMPSSSACTIFTAGCDGANVCANDA